MPSFRASKVAEASDVSAARNLAANVQKGMDALDVVKILGNPLEVKKWGSRPGDAKWSYYHYKGDGETFDLLVTVVFKGHKVSATNAL